MLSNEGDFQPNDYVFEEDEELYENYGEFFEEFCPQEAEYWSEEANYDWSYYFYESTEPTEQRNYSCDTCEKDFWSKDYLDKHMSEHITCKLDGCTFTAHEKIVEKHIRMQHATGLYDKIKKLNTPEDIANWIEERKKKYPNKENIEKRYAQQLEKIKSGERIQKNDNRFGKDKFRWGKNQRLQKSRLSKTNKIIKKRKQKPPPKVSLIDEKANWNGSMFPFCGTLDLFKEEEAIKSDFEDDEWQETEKIMEKKKQPVLKLKNALGALMGAYGSDSEEECDAPIEVPIIQNKTPLENVEDTNKVKELPKTVEANVTTNEISDDEPPDEVKIVKHEKPEVATNLESQKVTTSTVTSTEANPNISTVNRQRQRKRKRPNKKEKSIKRSTNNSPRQSTSEPHSTKEEGFSNKRFKKRKITLLEKLLASEIREERNFLLRCVRYTVSNNFLRDAGS